jgi:hypothetical protein
MFNNSFNYPMECGIRGYNGDKRVCNFYYEKEEETTSAYGYIYCFNAAVSISGTEKNSDEYDITEIREYNYTYSVNAKRGWNMLYTIRDEEETIIETVNGIKRVYNRETTTTDPGNLKWKVSFWDGSQEHLKTTKRISHGVPLRSVV